MVETPVNDVAKDGTPKLSTANESLRSRGYRGYVGGNDNQWESIGRLQFDFMCSSGLTPGSILLDIACGSLRAGRHFIPYLDPTNYLGIELENDLIQAGLRFEIDPLVVEEKAPEFVVSGSFEFSKFSKKPDYSIANSLFTHLTPEDILACLSNLRENVDLGHQFYATFFKAARPVENPSSSDAHKAFRYTTRELKRLARLAGFDTEYIGDWSHPRRQQMLLFRPM